MTIAFLFHGDYPWDVRVQKMCRTLAGAGHEVHLICGNRAARPLLDVCEGCRVHRMPAFRGRLTPINNLLSLHVFFNPMWLSRLAGIVRQRRPQIIIVRDMPLAVATTAFGRAARIPVVVDMAENYPAAMADWNRSQPMSFKSLLLRNVAVARMFERLCVRLATHILVVCHENGERLLGMGVAPGKITVVGNTPWPDFGLRQAARRCPQGARLRLVYSGQLEKYRGVCTCVVAVALLKRQGIAVELRLLGGGHDQPRLRELARGLGVADQVLFHARIPYDQLPAYLAQCDIGLVPHLATDFIQTTMPNKIFEYMAVGLPVVVSDARPLARLVAEVGCGLAFRSGDAVSLAEAVASLTSAQRRREMGEKGRLAVAERYNWSVDGARLLQVLKTVAGARPS